MSIEETLTDQTAQEADQTEPVDEKSPHRRRPRSFNERVGEAELLVDAMEKNMEELSARGGSEEFVNQLKAAIQEVKTINSDQEKAKATMKDLTSNVNRKLDDLDKLVSDGRKIVKMVINQERWVGFGINVTQ
jgi:molybdopterin converting factor small subunit